MDTPTCFDADDAGIALDDDDFADAADADAGAPRVFRAFPVAVFFHVLFSVCFLGSRTGDNQ